MKSRSTLKQNPLDKRQLQDKDITTQLKTIFHFLRNNVATAAMVEEATGVHHKNICRFKRDLEKTGCLWEVFKGYCQRTGYRAWYLTCDPKKAPKSDQIKLF